MPDANSISTAPPLVQFDPMTTDNGNRAIILAAGKGRSSFLTDNQIEQIVQKVNDTTKDNKEYQKLAEMPSNNGVEEREAIGETIEGEEKTYVVNPDTGQYKEEEPTEPEQHYDFTITMDHVNSYFEKGKIDKNIVTWDLKNITPEDIFTTVDYYQKHDNTIKFKVLPQSIRNLIYKTALNEGSVMPQLLDLAADHFASTMLIEFQAFMMDEDYKKGMQQASVDALSDLAKVYEDEVFGRQETIQKLIDEAEDEEKKEQLKKILNAYIESYELASFKEDIEKGEIKVKKIDIDKPQKVFAEFNYKYEYNEKFNIHCGIHHLVPIIQTFADTSYTNTEICLLLVLFCKYCRNFKPTETAEGIEQHSFMSFFISNVYSLRMVAQGAEQTEFQAKMIEKINSLIDMIRKSSYQKFLK